MALDFIILQQKMVRTLGSFQVQLQSLKVLSALVSEHLSIIHKSLPLIQHVITVCSDAVREPPAPKLKDQTTESQKSEVGDGQDPALMSPDPGKMRCFVPGSLTLCFYFIAVYCGLIGH